MKSRAQRRRTTIQEKKKATPMQRHDSDPLNAIIFPSPHTPSIRTKTRQERTVKRYKKKCWFCCSLLLLLCCNSFYASFCCAYKLSLCIIFGFTFESLQLLHGCSNLSKDLMHGLGSSQNARSEWLNHMSKRQCSNASLFQKSV